MLLTGYYVIYHVSCTHNSLILSPQAPGRKPLDHLKQCEGHWCCASATVHIPASFLVYRSPPYKHLGFLPLAVQCYIRGKLINCLASSCAPCGAHSHLMQGPWTIRSGGQARAAARAPARNDSSAAAGAQALQEAVAVLAHAVAGLVRALDQVHGPLVRGCGRHHTHAEGSRDCFYARVVRITHGLLPCANHQSMSTSCDMV